MSVLLNLKRFNNFTLMNGIIFSKRSTWPLNYYKVDPYFGKVFKPQKIQKVAELSGNIVAPTHGVIKTSNFSPDQD